MKTLCRAEKTALMRAQNAVPVQFWYRRRRFGVRPALSAIALFPGLGSSAASRSEHCARSAAPAPLVRARTTGLAACVVLLMGLPAAAAGRPLPFEHRGDAWRFGDERLRITLNAATGAWTGLDRNGRPALRESGAVQYFDVRSSSRWLTGGGMKPRLEKVRRISADEIAAQVRTGAWTTEFHYILYPDKARIRRWVRITWHGPAGEREKLRGFWLRTPQVRLAPGGVYLFPARWPLLRRRVGEFEDGRKTSTGRGPGIVIVQMTPRLSGIWLSDELTPRSDRPSASVTEGRGTLRVGQGYQCEGWVKPGVPQDVGDAWLWLVEGDAETALHRVHDLLRDLGHTPPSDRPDWFRRAVLYSLHPGGTIGSQFRDLGGFGPATALLDTIRDLGCNSVWVLPIEDSGVYHPRDYYKFQKGVGSVEAYRAFVRKAHALKLHVLRDIVPHGGTNDCPRAKAHPEWLLRTETGGTLSYWCFDFNWPSWIQYMAKVARDYMTQADIDGFRVDAVYGSKISNWNPDIPYSRASFARLQGGLHMLRAIRQAVKSVKPRDGGVLAEVGSSAHGTVSDAVYDFTLCYSVLHDLRRRSAAESVPDIQRWLYEQDKSEAPDLIRVRHIESHDSLRSLLWYGLRPQRALMALTAWIHGMPLVYHEMEYGSSAVFRRIFRIRAAVPELGGGPMDSLAVSAPAGVFACLRSSQPAAASVVLVNFNPERARGRVRVLRDRLPTGLRSGPRRVLDAWNDCAVRSAVSVEGGGVLELPLDLPPFGFTVYVLRRGDPAGVPQSRDGPLPVEQPAGPPMADPAGCVLLTAGRHRLWIDRRAGLPVRFDLDDHRVLGPADLVLDPVTCNAAASACELRTSPGVVRVRRRFGDRSLDIVYRAGSGRIVMDLSWSAPGPPLYAAFHWPVDRARRWSAACAEGLFEDRYRVRHRTTDGVIGSIYWRPQGTATVWDSLLHPFGAHTAAARLGAAAADGQEMLTFIFPDAMRRPVRVRWLDRVGKREQLGLLAAWSDPDAADLLPGGRRGFRLVLGAGPRLLTQRPGPAAQGRAAGPSKAPEAATVGKVRVVPAVGGWLVTTLRYRLRLSRSGAIVSLRRGAGAAAMPTAVDGDIYTDAGFSRERTFYAASDDVEAASWIDEAGDGTVRLRFFGRLRGFHRFDKMPVPVWYVTEYVLRPEAPGFRMACAVRPEAPPFGARAFLAWRVRTRGVAALEYRGAGRKIAVGDVGNGSRRVLQSRNLPNRPVPDEVRLLDARGRPLLYLTDLRCGGGRRPGNVFMHGGNFFVTWYDGAPDAAEAGRWSWFTTMITPGPDASPAYGPKNCELRGASVERPAADVRMPGFEELLALRPRFLSSGARLPVVPSRSPWSPPPTGGRVVTDVVHGGRAAAFVENRTGGYLLWTQDLPVEVFKPGTRRRLSAWVRGEAIVRGTPAWKTGTVRWTFIVKGKAHYVSSEALLGTFDWRRVAVDAAIPEGVERILIQIGLNGSRGRMWIDDVRLVTLPIPGAPQRTGR